MEKYEEKLRTGDKIWRKKTRRKASKSSSRSETWTEETGETWGGDQGKHDKNKKSTRQVGGGGWWLVGLQVIDYSFHLKSTR